MDTPKLLPLKSFFDALRREGFEIDFDAYFLLLEALNGGFGLRNETSLLALVKILWLKPKHDLKRFEQLFVQAWEQDLTKISFANQIKKAEPLLTSEKTASPDSPSETFDRPQETQEETPAPETTSVSDEITIKELTLSFQGDRKIGFTDLGIAKEKQALENIQFSFDGEYLPLENRQLRISKRILKNLGEQKPTKELDEEATIENFATQGILAPQFFQLPAGFHTVVLIDRQGSMVPFHEFSEQLAKAFKLDNPIIESPLYFNNIPHEYFYADIQFSEAVPFKTIQHFPQPNKLGIIIISDAGAARGSISQERIQHTSSFIRQMKLTTQKIVWLNPMPTHRWRHTSAEQIAQFVEMYWASTDGVKQAIDILKSAKSHELV